MTTKTKKVKVGTNKVQEEKSPVDSIIGLAHEQKLIGYGISANAPILLIGETGVGKTHMINELGKEAGKRVVRVSTTGEIGIQEILGKWLIKKKETV